MTSKTRARDPRRPTAVSRKAPATTALAAATRQVDRVTAAASTTRAGRPAVDRTAKVDTKPVPATAGKKHLKPRPVLVRDSFTMPEADFALIAKLKAKALGGQRAAKKSELLRAGLQMLASLDSESLVAALNRLETVKTGRPKKGH